MKRHHLNRICACPLGGRLMDDPAEFERVSGRAMHIPAGTA